MPFPAVAVHAPVGNDLVYGDGRGFELQRYGEEGEVEAAFRRPWDPRPVTEADTRRFRDHFMAESRNHPELGSKALDFAREYLAELEYPDHFPPYSEALSDSEGNLWVEEYRWPWWHTVPPDPPDTWWSVFDADGVWLGRVRMPGRFLVRDIGSDYVLGVWRDEDGVGHIRQYEIIKPGVDTRPSG